MNKQQKSDVKLTLPAQSTEAPQQRKLWHDHEADFERAGVSAGSTRVIPHWDWQGIWTRGNFVYALDEWRDRHGNWRSVRDKRGLHQFVEVLPGSVRAEKWRRQLESMWALNPGAWSGWTRKLRQFLYQDQAIPIPDARPIPNVKSLLIRGTDAPRWIDMASIIPTQPEFDMWGWWQYVESGKPTDKNGHFAHVVQFAGDGKDSPLYMVDGHHRLMAQRYRKYQKLLVDVQQLPVTLGGLMGFGKVETLEAVYVG